VLARACAASGTQLLVFSTDLVFGGDESSPYLESGKLRPLNVYGLTKAAAEKSALEAYSRTLVVRTSAFFGPWDTYNFLTLSLSRLAAGLPVQAADDWFVSPTYVPDLVNRCLDLLIDDESGIWHLANSGVVSWAQFAREAAAAIGFDQCAVRACSGDRLKLRARRPRFSALGSSRGRLLPPLEDAIRRYCEMRQADKLDRPGHSDMNRGQEASTYVIIDAANRPASASAVGA
jgi:dTDP-4-dehydrorhamnose reductase